MPIMSVTIASPPANAGPDADRAHLPDAFRPSAVAVAGTCVAVGEIAGGLVFGRLADRYGRKRTVRLASALHGGAIALVGGVLLTSTVLEQGPAVLGGGGGRGGRGSASGAVLASGAEQAYHFMLAAGGLLGMGDAAFSTAMYSLIGDRYKGPATVTAFACFKFAQSFAAAAAFLYSAVLPLSTQLAILLVTLAAAVAGVCAVDSRLGAPPRPQPLCELD